MRLRLRPVMAVLAAAAGLAPVLGSMPHAAAACAAPTRYLAGTISGFENNDDVNAMVGVQLFDPYGHTIAMDGCAMGGGYATHFSVNPSLSTAGAPAGTPGYTSHWEVTGLPSNAAYAWLEVYPKDPPYGYYTDTTYYGMSFRGNTPLVPVDQTDVRLSLPVVGCGAGTANTGEFLGLVEVGGHPVTPSSMAAWSMDNDQNFWPLGFGEFSMDGPYVRIGALAYNQPYRILVTVWTGTHYAYASADSYIYACKMTPIDFFFPAG